MTTQQANVNNGIAQITIDTSELSEGNHNIQATYQQNNSYKSSTANATLTINPAGPALEESYYIAEADWEGFSITANGYTMYPSRMEQWRGDYGFVIFTRTNVTSANVLINNNSITRMFDCAQVAENLYMIAIDNWGLPLNSSDPQVVTINGTNYNTYKQQ